MATRRNRPAGRKRKAAATEEVLNGGPRPAKIPGKWRKHYARLVELRNSLNRRRSTMAGDALSEQPTFSTHMADAGTDTFDRDLALGFLSTEQDAIYEIDEAIERIRNGDYGICELTGKPIDPARLESVPFTRFSAEAERQLEREGSLKPVRIGPRETVGRESPENKPEETE